MDTKQLRASHERLGHALEQAHHAVEALHQLLAAVEYLAVSEHARGMAYRLQAQQLFKSTEAHLHLALLQLLRARKVFDAAQEVSKHDT